MKNEIAALNYTRNDTTSPPPYLPRQGGGVKRMSLSRQEGGCKRGFTLIEVVLAVVVLTVAVAATLVIMSKMMGYTVGKGQAVDISNAVTISQMVIDGIRDQRFPPTGGTYGTLATTSRNWTISGTTYTDSTVIEAFDGGSGTSQIGTLTGTTEYYDSTNGDSMLGYRNLLKVTVTVSRAGRPIFKTVTYKTRNGYY
jgi:prepilin-type N-terminal cleavage/methylation domain-containing protein